jgi:hypothetical protein
MGNSSSKGNLSLVVHPPQNSNPAHHGYYLAGKKITGVIYATNNAQLQLSQNNLSLNVYLTGKENVKVRYTDHETYYVNGESHTRSVTRYAYASRDIVRISIPVTADRNTMAPGKYEFPFEVNLTHSNVLNIEQCIFLLVILCHDS